MSPRKVEIDSAERLTIRVRTCLHAPRNDKDTAYTHAYCGALSQARADTVCVSPEYYFLPRGIRYGLLAHEIGRLFGHKNITSYKADLLAQKLLGRIDYLTGEWGADLQRLKAQYWKWFEQQVEIIWLDRGPSPEPLVRRQWVHVECVACDWRGRRTEICDCGALDDDHLSRCRLGEVYAPCTVCGGGTRFLKAHGTKDAPLNYGTTKGGLGG